MQKIQLYIEGERVDMFDDESVVITQTIKNVKDVGKIFTDFTRTFSLPASKTNNKIFKHYYNYHIQNGFDARTRKPANIELNTLPFTDGRVKLEGVDLKDNKPHTYKITFFGSTVTLKDLVGDDTLAGLSSLISLNKSYDADSVRDSLQDDPTTNDIIVPLITHTQKLHYNSHSSDTTAGNLHYKNGHITGVGYYDLKYAIRLHSIIQAIETKYPSISFSNDFFNTYNAPYYKLFMWLHRKKGSVENLSGVSQAVVDNFANQTDANTLSNITNNSTLNLLGENIKYFQKLLILEVATTTSFSVSIQNNGIEIYNTGQISSNTTINLSNYDFGYAGTVIYIESENVVVFTKIEWEISYRPSPSQLFTKYYTVLNYGYQPIFTFDITQQIPNMKVIDFISGLFKTFNLTAYVDKITNEIVVDTLDSFYSGGSSYDITKYVDVSKSQVNISLPYKEISFEHEDTNTKLASIHGQKFGKVWGKENFTNDQKLDGGIYKVKTPFSQLKYERLIDADNNNIKDIQWGYFVDDNDESYFGKPLIFYPIRQTQSSISFLNSLTDHDEVTEFNIPSNSVALASSTSSYNINFYKENNEYGALQDPSDNGFTNTLFQAYYSNYITSVFNPTNRITKVTAYLPLRILLNYTLADRFVIAGNSYKINSIKTNLKNGKSDIELLNDL